jgi:hypothetical protein
VSRRLVVALLLWLVALVTLGTADATAVKPARDYAVKPARKSLPRISGSPFVGRTLHATPGRWTGATRLVYQWKRCNAHGAKCKIIHRARTANAKSRPPAKAYTVTSADLGHTIRVTVLATNPRGTTSATSRRTAVIKARLASVLAPTPTPTSTTGSGNPSGLGVGNMPLISRGLPAFSGGTSGLVGSTTSAADDNNYTETNSTYFGFLSTTTYPSYLAYNLSSVPAVQQGKLSTIYTTWDNGVVYYYDQATETTGDAGVPYDYTIDVACQSLAVPSMPTTGWVTEATVTANTLRSRSHVVNMTDTTPGNQCNGNYNWIRINVTAGQPGQYSWKNFQLKWDIWDASQNMGDTWMVYGDSITANIGQDKQTPYDNTFGQDINAWNPSYYPSFENGGMGGWTAARYLTDATTTDGTGDSSPWLPKTPAHFLILALGTNDCNGGLEAGFSKAMTGLVDAAMAAQPGRVVIIPTMPASPDLRSGTNSVLMWNGSSFASTSLAGNGEGPICNQVIHQVVSTEQAKYGASRVLAGPDLWNDTIAPTTHWDDGLHPYADAMGDGILRSAWVQWAETNVF